MLSVRSLGVFRREGAAGDSESFFFFFHIAGFNVAHRFFFFFPVYVSGISLATRNRIHEHF